MSTEFWVFVGIAVLVLGVGGFARMAQPRERRITPQRREEFRDE